MEIAIWLIIGVISMIVITQFSIYGKLQKITQIIEEKAESNNLQSNQNPPVKPKDKF